MKVAIAGLGSMGIKTILHLRKSPHVTRIAGYDIDRDKLDAARTEHGIDVCENYEDILDDDDVKLVYVKASNDAHKELTVKALEAGKAVMCEKPMALSLEDAEEMVLTAERLGGFLQIGFELRYSKMFVKIKEWIDQGLLGDVVCTHCQYICSEFHGKKSWRNYESNGGSMFGEKLSHYVDLPRWWIGDKVEKVISMCAPNVIPYYEVKDNYQTTYSFSNGAVSHLSFMMAVAPTMDRDPLQNLISVHMGDGHENRYIIEGTKGAASTSIFDRQIRRWEFGDSDFCMTSELVEEITWDSKYDDKYVHNLEDQDIDIAQRVALGKPPMTDARDSFETMKLVFAAEESANTSDIVRLDDLVPVQSKF
ncbi:Inositol 2-dehydrogenase [Limihaloglobus sulfuriphilus]|uniref:Inositol 2-dehydrogenase n=1 Tax=Limihaloglobus sulfuriphilus TaxID=1851148 RepID=A0A1Q2MEG4_9BACT|nr:Gfo/Idh/MocA family oxidoreductase [Limihaloglobus sulfuriphilus]AQQ71039.1 Inositol 2-dehydrogenase [Limihaloglobus sulfuriphilus]